MCNELILRHVTIDDAPMLQANCWPDSSLEAVRSLLLDVLPRQQRGVAWGIVAEWQDDVVAYGQLTYWGRIGEISDLIVSQDYRGSGIGSAIIQHLIQTGKARGLRELEIGVQESNERALTLYRKLGFVDKRRVMMEFGGGPEPVLYLSMMMNEGE